MAVDQKNNEQVNPVQQLEKHVIHFYDANLLKAIYGFLTFAGVPIVVITGIINQTPEVSLYALMSGMGTAAGYLNTKQTQEKERAFIKQKDIQLGTDSFANFDTAKLNPVRRLLNWRPFQRG